MEDGRMERGLYMVHCHFDGVEIWISGLNPV
jgi:hypothetical protein